MIAKKKTKDGIEVLGKVINMIFLRANYAKGLTSKDLDDAKKQIANNTFKTLPNPYQEWQGYLMFNIEKDEIQTEHKLSVSNDAITSQDEKGEVVSIGQHIWDKIGQLALQETDPNCVVKYDSKKKLFFRITDEMLRNQIPAQTPKKRYTLVQN